MQILLKLLLLAVIAVIIALLIILPARQFKSGDPVDAGSSALDLPTVLGGGEPGVRTAIDGVAPDAAFARAAGSRVFAFPQDHGPHFDYRNEWWYFTGNLDSDEGHRFGIQWVIFRAALQPGHIERDSAWGTNQAYMAHFAVTDATNRRHHYFERFARGGAGLAGAANDPLRVWLEDWSLQEDQASGRWTLHAAQDDIAYELTLEAVKPVVLNGERGLSQKSAEAGNASWYYAITRLDARGILRIGDMTHKVGGLLWLDREWSTSALADDQTGWDWFALQLDDGSDLMFYQLRRKDGSVDPFSSGTLTDSAGHATSLAPDEVILEVINHWQSPHGPRYPAHWRLSLPARGLELEIRPIIAEQELRVSIPYWEGAVDVSGTHHGQALAGRGYVELVGY